ncbi:hypothetical protein ACHAXS_008850 [Conticribra weissflogii]
MVCPVRKAPLRRGKRHTLRGKQEYIFEARSPFLTQFVLFLWYGSFYLLVFSRVLGFFIELGGGSTGACNALLSIYYWLRICKGVRPSTFAKYEPFAHVAIFSIFCCLATTGVVIKLFNPGIGTCFILSYPPGCETGPGTPPCDRFPRESLGLYLQLFFLMWIQMYVIIVTITHILIWRHVRKQDKTINRYLEEQTLEQAQTARRSRSVAVQSTLYVCSFISCWIGPIILFIIGSILRYQSFWGVLITNILTPLQGFWNAFVFARPMYSRIREKYPEIGRFEVVKIVFFDPDFVMSSNAGRNIDNAAAKMESGNDVSDTHSQDSEGRDGKGDDKSMGNRDGMLSHAEK